MDDAHRQRFDDLLDEGIEAVPGPIRALMDEVPLIVDDRPDAALARSIAAEFGEDVSTPKALDEFASTLCGLHSGAMITERSVEDPTEIPGDIRLFREGIVEIAGGWAPPDADDAIYEEILITLLHEIGHHFGLSEEDLERLGYE